MLTVRTSSFSRHIPCSPSYLSPSPPAASPLPPTPSSSYCRRPLTTKRSRRTCRCPPGTECSSFGARRRLGGQTAGCDNAQPKCTRTHHAAPQLALAPLRVITMIVLVWLWQLRTQPPSPLLLTSRSPACRALCGQAATSCLIRRVSEYSLS